MIRDCAYGFDEPKNKKAALDAANEPPTEFVHQQGWVLIAFQKALSL
jgi:hypothetical protein